MICQICLKKMTNAGTSFHAHDSCLTQFFGSRRVEPILDFTRTEFFTDKARDFTQGFSISGVQQKLSVKIADHQLQVTSQGGTYILKPTPESFPELSANEHLSLKLSQAFGIETAESGLVRFSDGELCLLVKRFDRTATGKIHQEDFVQAMNIEKVEGKYSSSYQQIGQFILANSSLAVARDYFQRIFFNLMIGNGDCHLKNLSLRKIDGIFQLTPNYDMVNTALYRDPSEMALDLLADDELTSERKKLGYTSRYDLDEFARRLGINQKTADSIYKQFIKREDLMVNLIENSFLSEDLRQQYLSILQLRKKRFFG